MFGGGREYKFKGFSLADRWLLLLLLCLKPYGRRHLSVFAQDLGPFGRLLCRSWISTPPPPPPSPLLLLLCALHCLLLLLFFSFLSYLCTWLDKQGQRGREEGRNSRRVFSSETHHVANFFWGKEVRAAASFWQLGTVTPEGREESPQKFLSLSLSLSFLPSQFLGT